MKVPPTTVFGRYPSSPKPYAFWGTPGWWSVPAGRNWYVMIDGTRQLWASPNVMTRNADGSISGSPLYACEMNVDGTLVFQDQMANRQLNIDSPPRDRLSQSN